MNDVRTLGVSDDAWQGLAVSNDGGGTYTESLIPGYPGDTSAAGMASPIRGNAAASDPWLGFDRFNNLYFAFIAFQRTPPGKPANTTANALAVAKYTADPATGAVTYAKTVVVERGTVGLGQQEDKEALAVDTGPSSPFNGHVYICWARFTGARTTSPSPLRATTARRGRRPASSARRTTSTTCRDATWLSSPTATSMSAIARSTITRASRIPTTARSSSPARATVAQRLSRRPWSRVPGLPPECDANPSVFRTFSDVSMAATRTVSTSPGRDGRGRRQRRLHQPLQDERRLLGGPGDSQRPGARHQLMPALAAAGGTLSMIWYDSRSEPALRRRVP